MQQEVLIAGTTLNFTTSVPEYPASSGWVLKYYLRLRTGAGAIDLTASAEGDDYRIQVPASGAGSTSLWTPGLYAWQSRVEKGTEVYPVDAGQITVQPNIAAAAGTFDSRSQAQKALDDAKAAFAAWTPMRRRYKIGQREMEFNGTAEIVQQIRYWELEVKREQVAQALAEGRPDPRITYTRLDRA